MNDQYIDPIDMDWLRRRFKPLVIILAVAFTGLLTRLFVLQVVDGPKYRHQSETNSIRLQSINAPRGLIFDRNGTLLVDNRPSFDLAVVPNDAGDVDALILKLSMSTGLPGGVLTQRYERGKGAPPYKPIVLASDIDRGNLAVVEAHRYDLPGVAVNVKPIRHYVDRSHAVHLIGYLSEINQTELDSDRYPDKVSGDVVGRFGIEKTYENVLSGKRGGRQVEVDSVGRVMRVLRTVEAKPGRDLHLTIDHNLQYVAERALKGQAGAVVAIDPRNGQVLALVSSPAFDQNIFSGGVSSQQWQTLIDDPQKPLINKAIQGEYPPGSTYKIITALAGLQEGVITPDSTHFCPGGMQYGRRTFRCWKRGGHGQINVKQAITESCDVFFYQTGLKLGVDRLAWYAKAFGLGTPTGIGLDHERGGLVPTADWKKKRKGVSWQSGETLSIAIGQGFNLVTPLQLAMMISSVANGGKLFKPTLVLPDDDGSGNAGEHASKVLVGRIPVSQAHLDVVRQGLWEVVNGARGTARSIRVEGIDISGKTGTSQVFTRRSENAHKEEDMADHLRSHAWFVAYAPSENPIIAVSVLVEHGAHGSTAAAPIAQQVITTYLSGMTNQVVQKTPSQG